MKKLSIILMLLLVGCVSSQRSAEDRYILKNIYADKLEGTWEIVGDQGAFDHFSINLNNGSLGFNADGMNTTQLFYFIGAWPKAVELAKKYDNKKEEIPDMARALAYLAASGKDTHKYQFKYEVVVFEKNQAIVVSESVKKEGLVCNFEFIDDDNLKIYNVKLIANGKVDDKTLKDLFFHIKRKT